MLIERVQFKNFKVLRDAELPLGQLTVLVGANGSGKSTAIEGILALRNPAALGAGKVSSGAVGDVRIEISAKPTGGEATSVVWPHDGNAINGSREPALLQYLHSAKLYSFVPGSLSKQSSLNPNVQIDESGFNLPTELDQLRDGSPERFEALNEELRQWLPEFDRILFDTPAGGQRSILLRYTESQTPIPAAELSYGTLAALAFLTIAYRKEPPGLVCFEEPDRGVHPRLLRRLQEALYRLAYPASFGETREPTQVILTTHSPYFLDLFKDRPEEVVVAERAGEEATFRRLVDIPCYEEILEGAPLGEVWYSGILGGVPAA